MAIMRDALGVYSSLRSITLVPAKLSPPIRASQSAASCGTGQGDVGSLSTMITPAMASSRRSSEARVGRSPSTTQASSTDHAGIR